MTTRIETVVSPMFAQNAYLIRRGDGPAIYIDPGFAVDRAFALLDDWGVGLGGVLNTHGHADHIAGNRAVRARYPGVPILIGRDDAGMLAYPERNLSLGFGVPVTSPPADRLLDDGETLDLAGWRFAVRQIPGHSPGSVVLIDEEGDAPVVFAGDVLFAGSVGRTDFPGGSFDRLAEGIGRVLFALPDDAVIYPGHGPSTTIGVERRTNPFVGEGRGGRSPS